MALRSFLRPAAARAAALAAGAALLLPTAALTAAAEPLPPGPRPAPPKSLLNEPGTHVRRMAGAPALPDDLASMSWLVADAGTGEVLAARNAHRRLPPASTLKTLFAVTVLPKLDPGARHRVVASDLAGMGDGSSLVGVETGHRYQVADLWRGVFLRSGNDAVHVLSAMAGGERSTVRQMQAMAARLGARDTHVVTPDGYDQPGQVSSAYDLAVFGRAGLANEEFARYCATATARFPGQHGSFTIQNTNRLLTGADGVGHYRGLVGVKNGYTTHAGNTLVAAARRGGHTVLVTVLHPQDGEHDAVYTAARALLDWGFQARGQVRPVGALPPVPPSPARTPARTVEAKLPPGAARWRLTGRSTVTVAAVAAAALLAAGGAFLGVRRVRGGQADG